MGETSSLVDSEYQKYVNRLCTNDIVIVKKTPLKQRKAGKKKLSVIEEQESKEEDSFVEGMKLDRIKEKLSSLKQSNIENQVQRDYKYSSE